MWDHGLYKFYSGPLSGLESYNYRGLPIILEEGPMIKSKNYKKKEKKAQGSSDTLSQIKSLIDDLRSEDGIVRHKARGALTFIGKRAVPELIPLLRDPNDDVRWEAAKALSEIIAPTAASDLVATLDDHNFGVRWLAAEGLIAIGRGALPPLMKALTKHSDSAWLREGAHHVLHDLANKGPEVKDFVAPVITALEGIEPEIGVVEPAYAALDKLKGLPKRQIKKGVTSGAKS
jgi:HEAT repeat protein